MEAQDLQAYKAKIGDLKRAILGYLASNRSHYGDMSRAERDVEDLAQALNTRLDQLTLWLQCGCRPDQESTPRERLAEALLSSAVKLGKGGRVDQDTADQFVTALDLLDQAADYRRMAGSAQDHAETAMIKDKRNKGA